MMMLMSQMKDSRDIHSERPGPDLEWLMMYQGNRPSNRGQPRECKDFSVIPTADIATLYRVPCIGRCNLCGKFVVNVLSTCTFLCSLERWPMFVSVIDVFEQLGGNCHLTSVLASLTFFFL